MSLFRFGERKWLEEFLKGNLSFGKATSYKDEKLTDAQRDNEQTRTLNPDLNKTHFFIEGYPIKNLKDVEVGYTARDIYNKPLQYYLMSFTQTFDSIMYKEHDFVKNQL